MRFIDLQAVLSDERAILLISAAEEARLAILESEPEERPTLIKKFRDRWVSFRPLFQEVFGPKCWYTESANPGVDDDIDHFRPKSGLVDDPDHGGYWWEALNWKNFRLSCHRANRLRVNPTTGQPHGKGAHFPLVDEAQRWTGPNEPNLEEPLLLDPIDHEDPLLLTFDPTGMVAISPAYESDPIAAQRVAASTTYLHLDWPAFVADRRNLYARVFMIVGEGDHFERAFLEGESSARVALKGCARDLIRLANPSQPYSRAAAAYICKFRDRPWIARSVLPHIQAVTVS